jgi:chromosome segregation ATPase
MSDLDKYTTSCNELEQRLQAASTRLRAVQEELSRSQDALAALQTSSTTHASQTHADLAAAKRVISELQQTISKQELGLAELKQLRLDHEVLLKSRAEANAAQTALSHRLQDAESRLALATKVNADQNKEWEQRIGSMADSLAGREVDNSLLRNALQAAEASVKALTEEGSSAANRVASLREQLDAAKADRNRLAKSLADAQGENSDKQSLLAQLGAAQTDNQQLGAKIQALLSELTAAAATARDLAECRVKLQNVQTELTQAHEATRNAKALHDLAESQVAQAERDRRAAEAKMAELKATTDVIVATQSAFEKTRKELEDHAGRAANRARHLRTLQEETCKTVRKLLTAEKSCESGYSCQQCLSLLKDPVMCVPCGHVFCRKCFEGSNKGKKTPPPAGSGVGGGSLHCVECDLNNVTAVVPAHSLDLLSGKFQYRCQVLSDLSALLEKELASAPL